MKRLRVDFMLAFTLFLIVVICFSIVQAATPSIVLNSVIVTAPYSTGSHDSDTGGKGDAEADADYDLSTGTAYARAFSSVDRKSISSNAWAEASLSDAFEIIHSSNYRITFNLDYKGLIRGTSPDILGESNIKAVLTVLLIDRNSGKTIDQKSETIFEASPVTADIDKEFSDSVDIVFGSLPLEEKHTYDWKAGVRTDTSVESGIVDRDILAEANFFDTQKDYRVKITQVQVEDLYPDNTPPTTSYSLSGTTGENGWYKSSVSISLTAVDNNPPNSYGVDYTNIRVNGGAWNLYTLPFTVNSEGVNTVEFYSVDKANNKEITKTININIDKTAPTGSFEINNDEEYTASREVIFSTEASDSLGSGVHQIRFCNEGEDWEPWIFYTTTAYWTLKSGDGNKRVYAQFKDFAGNISPMVYDDITLDTESPSGTITINNDEQYTTSTAVILLAQASDGQGSGVYQMRLRNEGENWEPWTTYSSQPISWTLKSGDGTKQVYVQFKDNAGNISPESYDAIILDTESPSGTITINNDEEYTNSTSVTLQLNYADNVDISKARYSNDGIWDTEEWETPTETKAWTLLPEEGIKTVYAQFQDNSGLDSVTVYDIIILDTTPPTGYIEINDDASETQSGSVDVTSYVTDVNGLAQMRLSNDGENWSDWETFVGTKTWDLTSGFGEKMVYAQFKDNAGLISITCTDTIEVVAPQPSPSPSPASSAPPARGTIIVYVRDPSNSPIEGATVTSTSQPIGQSSLKGVTDSSGSVTFHDLIAGSYYFSASKNSFSSNPIQVKVESQDTTSLTITLHNNLNDLNLSLTLTPADLGIAQRVFTVKIDDYIFINGISNVTLYVDEIPVITWTTAGEHTYEDVYSVGTHTYYIEALDNTGVNIRNPTSGNWEFTVTEATLESIELWKLLGVILVLANGTALIYLSQKRKK